MRRPSSGGDLDAVIDVGVRTQPSEKRRLQAAVRTMACSDSRDLLEPSRRAFLPGLHLRLGQRELIVGAVCLLVSVQMLMLGLLADLLRTNRVITERVLRRVRNIELSLGTYGNTEEESDSDF